MVMEAQRRVMVVQWRKKKREDMSSFSLSLSLSPALLLCLHTVQHTCCSF